MSTPINSTTSVPLSEGEERLLKVALAHLACPFEAAGPGGVCALVRTTGCSLGHVRLSDGSSVSPPAKLQTIPPYICVDSLLGVCSRPAGNLINGPSSSTMPPSLQRCIFGFHPKPTDLASLDLYRNKLDTLLLGPGGQKEPKDTVSMSVQTEDDSNAATESITCGVCLEVIPSGPNQLYGLPESCSHVFCAACLSTWRQQAAVNHSRNRAARGGGRGLASRRLKSLPCPSCRQPSKRLLIWPLPLTSTDEKKRALDYQERCLLGTAARAQSGVNNNQDEAVASEEEEENSSDTDVADYDDEDDDDVEPMFGRYFFSEPGALSIFRALNHLATHHVEEDGHPEGDAGPEDAEAREAAANAHDQEVD